MIYDIKTNSLEKLFDQKVQEPLFSPDGLKVAYVYRRNLFIKNLELDIVKQITYDGDYQTINGITDWVYEEEFGFVRAFDWSQDSNQIVYMRFDESNVPIFSMDIYSLYPGSLGFGSKDPPPRLPGHRSFSIPKFPKLPAAPRVHDS